MLYDISVVVVIWFPPARSWQKNYIDVNQIYVDNYVAFVDDDF